MAIKAPIFWQTLIFLLLCLTALPGCIDDGAQTRAGMDNISRQGDTPAARVGQTFIYESDILRAARLQKLIKTDEILTPESDIYQTLLNELVDQRLLKLAAIEADVQNVSEVNRRLAEARERILATYYVETHLKGQVSDEKLQKMYEAQSSLRQNGLEAKVRLLSVKTQAAIKAADAKLAAGADFAALAQTLGGDDVSGLETGELGFVSRAMLPDDIAAMVFATQAGARSKPFQTQKGWHIVEVERFRRPPEASFEAMRPQLLRYRTYLEIQNLMTELRTEGEVEILSIPLNMPSETDNE